MIILDDESSSSERSPLKSPVAPVTAARYVSPTEPTPPTYTFIGSSSTHLPYHHHPQSPVSPHPHAYSHAHHHHNSVGAGSIHSTNLPPHIVKLIEEREIRHKTLHRFFTSFAVAFCILLVWSTLVRGITLTIIHSTSTDDIQYPEAPPSPFIQWPQVYSRPEVEPRRLDPSDAKSFSLKLPVLVPQPTVSLTITPTPVAERILSIAYPPSPLPSHADG